MSEKVGLSEVLFSLLFSPIIFDVCFLHRERDYGFWSQAPVVEIELPCASDEVSGLEYPKSHIRQEPSQLAPIVFPFEDEYDVFSMFLGSLNVSGFVL